HLKPRPDRHGRPRTARIRPIRHRRTGLPHRRPRRGGRMPAAAQGRPGGPARHPAPLRRPGDAPLTDPAGSNDLQRQTETTMRAVVKNSAERGAEYVTDYPDPTAAEGHVVIEVAAASLCGTDREVYEWTPSAQAFNLNLPVAIGHEGAGTIVEVGPGVTGLRVGDRVALESHLICGQCFPCRTGDAHTCERTRIIG